MFPIVVSWSEIDCYRQCPFKHQLAYKERWTQPPRPGGALAKGTLWHKVMEFHYKAKQREQQGRPWSPEFIERRLKALLGTSGNQTDDQELIQWMFEGYQSHWGLDLDFPKIKAVEYGNEFWLPVPPGSSKPHRYKIKMRLDLIIEDPNRRLWIVDHKSGKNLPSEKMLELDDQFGLYCWGLRQLGMKIHGAMHNAARTYRYTSNKEQPLEERFQRTRMYRTDKELDRIALDAYATARRAYTRTPLGTDAERNPNSDTCRWRCDYTEACLAGRKTDDANTRYVLEQTGFTQERERH